VLLSSLHFQGVSQGDLSTVFQGPFALLASVVRDKRTQDVFVAQAQKRGLNVALAESLSPKGHFRFLCRNACEPIRLYLITAPSDFT